MSDAIKHECGIALLRLLKPLEYYREKYGTAFYGVEKMYLLMEKQHNRGQDGAGFASIKLDVKPGQRYISRIRSNQAQPIQDIFGQINSRISEELAKNPSYQNNVALQKENIPYVGELFLLPATRWNPTLIGSILYLGAGTSAIAFLCWNLAIQKLGAGRTVLFGNLIPVFSIIEAVLILGEKMSAAHLISGTIVILGLTIANIKSK